MEALWIAGGLLLGGIGVVRLKSGVGQFFGGSPDVAWTRHLSRGGMFLAVAAVMVVTAWNQMMYG